MKIILLKDISKLGKKDEVKEVNDSYAFNFLLPQKMAVRATAELIAAAVARQKRAETEKVVRHDELESAAGKLNGKKIIIEKEASAKGKLFASVSAEEILMAIKKELGVTLDSEHFKIKEHLKEVGIHEVPLQVGGKRISITVEIKAKEETTATKTAKTTKKLK
ncbi:MAG: 50S ribosomal protein L9 [Patescibacteria group bacterium]|nr:50S ribosomal protein L9 [Patescibacteria group bacterium]